MRATRWRYALFLRLPVDEPPPDHTTISRTRRVIDAERHRAVFTWVQQRLVAAGLLKGKTIVKDATTLEANAAMRSTVRRAYRRVIRSSGPVSRRRRGSRRPRARTWRALTASARRNLERRLEIFVGSSCEDREDERWADAPGPQS